MESGRVCFCFLWMPLFLQFVLGFPFNVEGSAHDTLIKQDTRQCIHAKCVEDLFKGHEYTTLIPS